MYPTSATHLRLMRESSFDPALHRLCTASAMVNIAGCGGIDWGTMLELQGPPSGGKSTFAYQTAEQFLTDYGDRALVLILDPENSANYLRLGRVFNLHIHDHPSERNPDPRVCCEFAPTFELAVEIVARYARRVKKEGRFLLIIWDSITMSKPGKEYDSMNTLMDAKEGSKEAQAGLERKMNDELLRPKMLKWSVGQVMTEMYRAPVIALLVNQATSKQTQFGMQESSGGGYGFKHGVHYSIKFKQKTRIAASSKLFSVGAISGLSIEKSKVIPYLDNIEIVIRDDLGGRLDYGMEVVKNSITFGFIHAKNGGWYWVDPEVVERFLPAMDPDRLAALQEAIGSTNLALDKNRQLRDLADWPPALAILEMAIENVFRSQFKLLNWAYEERDEVIQEYLAKRSDAKK